MAVFAALTLSAAVAGCAGNGGSGTAPSSSSYTVGGTVSGLSGTLVLQDNGSNDLTVSADGTFSFAGHVADGGAYDVTALTQPEGQTCTISQGAGTVAGLNVTGVAVTCATNTYTVGGTVSGLTGPLVLQDNGGDDLTVSADGAFAFATPVAYGEAYDVTVRSRPAGQECAVSAGAGTAAAQNVTGASVACTAARYVTDQTVSAIALGPDGTTYIGGDFTYVGPVTGSGAPIDSATGQVAAVFPDIEGPVRAAAPDGSGGWYIGGRFTSAGGLARNGIAHVLADGKLDPDFNPDANGAVYALVVSGDTVYAGGDFTSIGGQSRKSIAALDAATGEATAWAPQGGGDVRAIAPSDTMIHVGGQFGSIVGGEYLEYYVELNP